MPSSGRVSFDDATLVDGPQSSEHWKQLPHQPGDELLNSSQELLICFREMLKSENDESSPQLPPETLAVWSCLMGYCEALATHKQRRYRIFPIPIDAIRRLVQQDFKKELLLELKSFRKDGPHRDNVREVANAVWSRAVSKPNVRDELHANSVYVCLRGSIDRKSLDCFGAAIVTISGLQLLGIDNSLLTLSEDHAYERHVDPSTGAILGTCEIAVPGSTKLAQSKRGRDISTTFEANKNSKLTPEASWLYMASNPVMCDSISMTLVAVMGNINCTIEAKPNGTCFASGQLFDIKRDLLWELYGCGAMRKFPFGMMELGDCEMYRASPKGEEWITVPDMKEPILMNEQLFREAMDVNQIIYDEHQVYPYLYAGHYHREAGNEGPDDEYRLVEAMRLYAQAARVASRYRYETGDCLQLNKHISAVALLIAEDILREGGEQKVEPRDWTKLENAVAVCTWLLAFFDSLFLWEENSGGNSFVEILSPSNKHSMSKLFQLFSLDMRTRALDLVFQPMNSTDGDGGGQKTPHRVVTTSESIPYFRSPQSKRLAVTGILVAALRKPKVSIREMELAIPADDSHVGDSDGGVGRRSKRSRR